MLWKRAFCSHSARKRATAIIHSWLRVLVCPHDEHKLVQIPAYEMHRYVYEALRYRRYMPADDPSMHNCRQKSRCRRATSSHRSHHRIIENHRCRRSSGNRDVLLGHVIAYIFSKKHRVVTIVFPWKQLDLFGPFNFFLVCIRTNWRKSVAIALTDRNIIYPNE